MLDINNLHIHLGNNKLHYNQQINTGEIVTLQGISGVGKSSLLLCIAGFIKPASGDVFWCGTNISSLPIEQRPVAMLFQENNLFEHISVYKNACLGLSTNNVSYVEEAANELNIVDQLQKMPSELSGGQRQRVGLLRTLLRDEAVILLDEPFAELDLTTRDIAANWVEKMARERNKTVLLVTHQQEDVQKLADRNWLIESC